MCRMHFTNGKRKRLKMDYKGDCINHIGCHCVDYVDGAKVLGVCAECMSIAGTQYNECIERANEFNEFEWIV